MQYQQTSREAWKAFIPVSAELDRQIMDAITSSEDGLTDYQVEQISGRSHQAVSGNRRWLVKRGWLKDSGNRRPLPNGRKAIVWVLTEATKPIKKETRRF